MSVAWVPYGLQLSPKTLPGKKREMLPSKDHGKDKQTNNKNTESFSSRLGPILYIYGFYSFQFRAERYSFVLSKCIYLSKYSFNTTTIVCPFLMFLFRIDIEYNKRLDRQRPCLEGDFSGGSNNIVQSNKSV